MCKEKTPGELLAEELFYRTKNAGGGAGCPLNWPGQVCRCVREHTKTFPRRDAKIERGSSAHHRGNAGESRATALPLIRTGAISPATGIYRNVRGKALILAKTQLVLRIWKRACGWRSAISTPPG